MNVIQKAASSGSSLSCGYSFIISRLPGGKSGLESKDSKKERRQQRGGKVRTRINGFREKDVPDGTDARMRVFILRNHSTSEILHWSRNVRQSAGLIFLNCSCLRQRLTSTFQPLCASVSFCLPHPSFTCVGPLKSPLCNPLASLPNPTLHILMKPIYIYI